jgi:hypothetical protein
MVATSSLSSARCRASSLSSSPASHFLSGATSSSSSPAFATHKTQRCGGVQKVRTRNVTSLRRPCSCNTVVTNLEVQDTALLDTPKLCAHNLNGVLSWPTNDDDLVKAQRCHNHHQGPKMSQCTKTRQWAPEYRTTLVAIIVLAVAARRPCRHHHRRRRRRRRR